MNSLRRALLILGICILLFAGWTIVQAITLFGSGTPGQIVPRMFVGIFALFGGGVLCVAALAARAQQNVSTLMRRFSRPDVATEIERLAKLRADGFITGEEYESAKKRLLETV